MKRSVSQSVSRSVFSTPFADDLFYPLLRFIAFTAEGSRTTPCALVRRSQPVASCSGRTSIAGDHSGLHTHTNQASKSNWYVYGVRLAKLPTPASIASENRQNLYSIEQILRNSVELDVNELWKTRYDLPEDLV